MIPPVDLVGLCQRLESLAIEVDRCGQWPTESLAACRGSGLFRGFFPAQFGGEGWTELRILQVYLRMSQSCLTTTFILTQWQAACRRILTSANQALKERLAPALAAGTIFATVGISHLTTSRQHLSQPVLKASAAHGGYRLHGLSPWVTGAHAADWIILGATLDDGKELLAAVSTQGQGINCQPGQRLLALTASCTDQVFLDDVWVPHEHIIAGPEMNLMVSKSGSGGGTGGLQTSTLALGLALRAIRFLKEQAEKRSELVPIFEKFNCDVNPLIAELELNITGNASLDATELRRQANEIVLRSTQAALQASKGSGFVAGHPVGRWAREGLFFLVWSCPPHVAQANLCSFAGLADSL